MDEFSSARPNTEEGASHGAQSCKASFRHILCFGSLLHRVSNPTMRLFQVVLLFTGCPIPELRLCNNKYIIYHNMVVCYCVPHAMRGTT